VTPSDLLYSLFFTHWCK